MIADGEMLMSNLNGWRQRIEHIRLCDFANRCIAFQAKGEGAEAARQTEPCHDLAELPRRLHRTHTTAVADSALLEQVAVARQNDTPFTAGDLGDLAVQVVVAVQGIETRHAQQPGKSAQMGIGD